MLKLESSIGRITTVNASENGNVLTFSNNQDSNKIILDKVSELCK